MEFHSTLRVNNLDKCIEFYTWLLGVSPKVRSKNHAVFVSSEMHLNFVMVMSSAKLVRGSESLFYHHGIGVDSVQNLLLLYREAILNKFEMVKIETTWSGTPLHQLWLTDPDGNSVEIYCRLSDDELKKKPVNLIQTYLEDYENNI
jgi:arsenate reductase